MTAELFAVPEPVPSIERHAFEPGEARGHYCRHCELPRENSRRHLQVKHGTGGYTAGCRCVECTDAHTQYFREWRAKRPKKRRGEIATTCQVEGCGKPRTNRNSLCTMHLQRKVNHGSEHWEPPTAWDKFDRNVTKGDGCWTWTGTTINTGYGMASINGERQLAHRAAYERVNGPIPAGLTIDHLCENKVCVRPDHLEAVEGVENLRRTTRAFHGQRAPRHCRNGHNLVANPPRLVRRSNGLTFHRCLVCEKACQERARRHLPEPPPGDAA